MSSCKKTALRENPYPTLQGHTCSLHSLLQGFLMGSLSAHPGPGLNIQRWREMPRRYLVHLEVSLPVTWEWHDGLSKRLPRLVSFFQIPDSSHRDSVPFIFFHDKVAWEENRSKVRYRKRPVTLQPAKAFGAGQDPKWGCTGMPFSLGTRELLVQLRERTTRAGLRDPAPVRWCSTAQSPHGGRGALFTSAVIL